MSVYGYLNCHDCRQTVWLGKAVHWGDPPSAYFHIGAAEEPPHWARPQLNQVLWKFLAEHTGHRIDVRLEGEQEELPEGGYRDIGGDGETGVGVEEYLAGWPGLGAGGRGQDAEPGAAADTGGRTA